MATRHLAEVVERFGVTDVAATDLIRVAIEKGLNVERAEKDKERADQGKAGPKQVLYVTDLGKECDRQVALGFRPEVEAEPFTLDSLINFGVGSAVESWLAGLIKSAGYDLLREASVVITVPVACPDCGPLEIDVRGRIDYLAALEVPDEVADELGIPRGSVIAIECKSDKSRSAARRLENNQRGQDDHKVQLRTYLYALRRGLVSGGQLEGDSITLSAEDLRLSAAIDYGLLVYVVKDQTRREPGVVAYFTEADDEGIDEILQARAYLAHRAKDHAEVPEIPFAYRVLAQFEDGKRAGDRHADPVKARSRYIKFYRIEERRKDIVVEGAGMLSTHDEEKVLALAWTTGFLNARSMAEVGTTERDPISAPWVGFFPCSYCSVKSFCWPGSKFQNEED